MHIQRASTCSNEKFRKMEELEKRMKGENNDLLVEQYYCLFFSYRAEWKNLPLCFILALKIAIFVVNTKFLEPINFNFLKKINTNQLQEVYFNMFSGVKMKLWIPAFTSTLVSIILE